GIYCSHSSPKISNCIISGNSGSGIYCFYSSPTITSCSISANSGGIYCRDDSSPTITNCTISGNSGGGIYCVYKSSPTITNCTFSGNSTGHSGGGMYNKSSSPTLINCTFSGNSTSGMYNSGGGMHNNNSNPTLVNCIFSGNSAYAGAYYGSGGGMYNWESSPTVTNCTFSGNSGHSGGGMHNSQSSPSLTNCTFIGNSASYGGGMSNYRSSPTVTNCTFSGNSAAAHGGGMRNQGGNPTVTNCTFSGNSANYGGATYSRNECNTTIINCTFAQNSAVNGNALAFDSYKQQNPSNIQITNSILADGGEEIWNNDDSTITITYSNIEGGYPGQGNIDADPRFIYPGYWDANGLWVEGDYHLLRTSPCVDAANDANVYTDIEGNVRPFDFPGVDNNGELPDFDMGAYELVPIEAAMQFTPQTLNCDSKGNWVKAHFTFPEGYWPEDVDVNVPAVAVPMGAESEYIMVLGNDDGLTGVQVGFDREAFCAHLAETGQIEVTVVGPLTTGQYFYGTDTIRIIDRPSKPRHRNSKPRPRHLKPRHRR
ncbi:MAG: right-handed parallel beta-helix repeat-containing protein, partial [Planctomycetota bacterium]